MGSSYRKPITNRGGVDCRPVVDQETPKKFPVMRLPVDQVGQFHQFVPQINQVDQS